MAWSVEQHGNRYHITRNGRRLQGEVFKNRNEALRRLREIRGPEVKKLEDDPEEAPKAKAKKAG